MSGIVVVASHRRSGTHLVLDSLRANGVDVHPRYMTLERIDPTHPKHVPVEAFERRLRSREGIVLVKTHALPGGGAWRSPAAEAYAARLLAEAPTIYVHRDGRDVLVSLYHFVASYSPAVADASFGAFIRAVDTAPDARGLTRTAYWQHHVLAWLDRQPTATAAFEGVRADVAAALPEIARAVGIQLRPTLQAVTLEGGGAGQAAIRAVLKRMGKGGPGVSTAIRPRTGSSGAWRDAFDAADLAWFDANAGEAFRRLGYA